MADSDDTVAAAHPQINLQANSYDFQKLHAAADHAEGLKREDNQAAAFGAIATDQAQIRDVVVGQMQIGVPEGHTLAKVEDAQGTVVTAAVYFADEKQLRAAQDSMKDAGETVVAVPEPGAATEADPSATARTRKPAGSNE